MAGGLGDWAQAALPPQSCPTACNPTGRSFPPCVPPAGSSPRAFYSVFSHSSSRPPPPPPPPGKLGGQDSFESIESYDSCDRLTQSWSSQSSFNSLQRVPSYDSFDSEDYPAALPNHKPKGTFKDYVRDRADLNKDKPVIPAAALAGYTGRHLPSLPAAGGGLPGSFFLSGDGEEKTLRGLVSLSSHSAIGFWKPTHCLLNATRFREAALGGCRE